LCQLSIEVKASNFMDKRILIAIGILIALGIGGALMFPKTFGSGNSVDLSKHVKINYTSVVEFIVRLNNHSDLTEADKTFVRKEVAGALLCGLEVETLKGERIMTLRKMLNIKYAQDESGPTSVTSVKSEKSIYIFEDGKWEFNHKENFE
jgi:hypothetical protein